MIDASSIGIYFDVESVALPRLEELVVRFTARSHRVTVLTLLLKAGNLVPVNTQAVIALSVRCMLTVQKKNGSSTTRHTRSPAIFFMF